MTGGAATLTHLVVALLLIRAGTPPLIGNALAFASAFMVSFWGHHRFSFAGHGAAVGLAFRRFLIVSGLGFVTNETVLFLLLQRLPRHPSVALLVSTAVAALLTFALSRHWAFQPGPLAQASPAPAR
nr:GtrA family protein [Paracoccus sp. S1E-3]